MYIIMVCIFCEYIFLIINIVWVVKKLMKKLKWKKQNKGVKVGIEQIACYYWIKKTALSKLNGYSGKKKGNILHQMGRKAPFKPQPDNPYIFNPDGTKVLKSGYSPVEGQTSETYKEFNKIDKIRLRKSNRLLKD
jgi:hypothetical protein